jgi:hypothetical protein
MCSGGRLLADFCTGSDEQPVLPEAVESCMTWTADETCVIWAHKVARSASRHSFTALTGGDSYPADAVAECRIRRHLAPQPDCTCGFHALSHDWAGFPMVGVRLDVVLSGRVLAFEWARGGVLFRAERQTVVRVNASELDGRLETWLPPPDDPDGRLAFRRKRQPRGTGPVRIRLPRSTPTSVRLADDAGYCALETRPVPGRSDRVIVRV